MHKKSSLLSKMADRLLKATDKADALEKSRAQAEKIKRLHEAITDRYRFAVSHNQDVSELDSQITFVKKIEKTLTPTWSQINLLDRLFMKYRIQ